MHKTHREGDGLGTDQVSRQMKGDDGSVQVTVLTWPGIYEGPHLSGGQWQRSGPGRSGRQSEFVDLKRGFVRPQSGETL